MDIVSLIDTTPFINSPLGIAQGAAGLSAYQVWLSVGNVGTVQQYIDSLKGEAGLDASFRVIDFDPVSGGGAADFIADQDSTVITPTIIGSENNGTSPTYNDGSFEVNYESATIIYVDAGDITLSASPDVDRVQVVYFHDGSVTTADYWDGVEAGSLAVGIGAAVMAYSALGDTNVSLTLASAPTIPQTDTLTGGDPSFIEVDGTNISVAALTDALDLSTYPHCTYIITQDPTVGAPANVPDIDYLSNFTQAVHDTPIPDDAIDGNYLKIITNNGVVLGDSVIIGDWCQLYDSKTKIHIEKDTVVITDDILDLQNGLADTNADVSALTSALSAIDASQVTTGIFNIARIPASAIERVVTVADQTARYALTTASVQNGDMVKQIAPNNQLYIVVDDSNLGNSSGYLDFNVGAAASVPWSGVTSTPTTLAGYGITDPVAKTNTANTFTASQVVTPTVNTSVSGTYTLDLATSNNFRLTFTGNVTFADPTNPVDGVVVNIEVIQDSTGSRILTKSSKMKTAGGGGLTLSTAIGAKDLISLIYDSANDVYLCNISKAYS